MTADPLAGAKWRVDCGDALELLRGLPEGCVNCVVTSPPLRQGRARVPAGPVRRRDAVTSALSSPRS